MRGQKIPLKISLENPNRYTPTHAGKEKTHFGLAPPMKDLEYSTEELSTTMLSLSISTLMLVSIS